MNHSSSMGRNASGITALLVLSVLFAYTGVIAKKIGNEIPLYYQLAFRCFVGGSVIFVLFPRQVSFLLPLREWKVLLLRTIASYIVSFTLFVLAAPYTTVSNLALLSSFPFASFLAVILFKEKFGAAHWIALPLACAGLLLVVGPANVVTFEIGRGEVMCLVSALALSFGLLARRYHRNVGDVQISVIMLLVSSACFLAIGCAVGEKWPESVSSEVLSALLQGAAVVAATSILAQYGFAHVSGSLAGVLLTLEPVFALFMDLHFFGTAPSTNLLIGGALIVSAVVTLSNENSINQVRRLLRLRIRWRTSS